MRNFYEDIKTGTIGEEIFRQDFLDFLGIKYENVTGRQQYQVIDTDYLTSVGKYEIKNNYKDNEQLIIEDYTNINDKLGNISLGWIYKTNCDLIVFVSQKTRTMVFMPFNDRFKNHYSYIRDNTKLIHNRISFSGNNKWQSAFRIVPFEMLDGYISIYKKL